MILHPLADEFHAALGRQGGARARARQEAFLRICEACIDSEGLPTLAGLRRLESGAWDERLGGDWKPLFVDVYRRWIGYRMEREFLEPERPLSLKWWFTAPALVRSRIHGDASRLFSPAAGMALLLVLVAGLGFGPWLSQHERRLSLQVAAERHELARHRLAAEEEQALAGLQRADDAGLEAFLARRGALQSMGEHAAAERDLLARRARLQSR